MAKDDEQSKTPTIAEYLVAGDLGRILKQRFGIAIDHSSESLK